MSGHENLCNQYHHLIVPQLTDTGVCGVVGLPVAVHVVMASRRETGHVRTPHLETEVSVVKATIRRCCSVNSRTVVSIQKHFRLKEVDQNRKIEILG